MSGSHIRFFQKTTHILATVHYSLQKTLDLGAFGELILVFVVHLLSFREQILACGCACRVHELSTGGQSVNKHLWNLPPGPPCAHYGPRSQPVNQYSNHNESFATFNILQDHNQF